MTYTNIDPAKDYQNIFMVTKQHISCYIQSKYLKKNKYLCHSQEEYANNIYIYLFLFQLHTVAWR